MEDLPQDLKTARGVLLNTRVSENEKTLNGYFPLGRVGLFESSTDPVKKQQMMLNIWGALPACPPG